MNKKTKNKIFACFIAAGILVAGSSQVLASVNQDLKAGASFEVALQNALNANMSIGDAMAEALETEPHQVKAVLTAALTVAPSQAANIVRSAIELGIAPSLAVELAVRQTPDQAARIVRAASAAAPESSRDVLQAAIAAGADPSIANAPAAGRPADAPGARPVLPAQAQRARPPVVPPPNRGRGGGVASPS